jgi:tetratricopeptide (TPR) repeat protein
MSSQFTPDQLEKLKTLGIDIDLKNIQLKNSDNLIDTSKPIELPYSPIVTQSKSKKISPFVPLLSISGLTLLSFGGIVLFKSKNSEAVPTTPAGSQNTPNTQISPTQVPKSIQHYLLTSQQYFSQALQFQQQNSGSGDQSSTVDYLNKSILAASDAIKNFPQDSRGYYQRGKIYQSLVDSKPELINQALTDIGTAQKLNPASSEITRDLASVYARKGDIQNTIIYLSQTVSLDPTKAQNFYDLAKVQQQSGLIPQALETYNRLLTLITDANQITQVELEKTALEKIIAENPSLKTYQVPSVPQESLEPSINLSPEAPTIQALANNNLIIAAPENLKDIKVENVTDSNSLSGTTTLISGETSKTINNSKLTPESQVYVTTLKGGKNLTLKVISKTEDSFVIGLDSPTFEDIEFKWWIIN